MNRAWTLIVLTAVSWAAVFGLGWAITHAAEAPLGYKLMCLQYPAECRAHKPRSVQLTPALMSTLRSVNVTVNRSIKPKPDVGDVWTVNASEGDCEDYVLAKRDRLIAAGVSAGALHIAIAKTRQGDGHALLIVDTDGGRFALDNLRSAIRPLSQTGYRVLSVL